jgi:hypothetical protein
MDVAKFKRVIGIAVDEAEQAADPHKSGLMDYGDLQRLMGRMTRALRYAERAYDDLAAEYEELSDRLQRPQSHSSPPSDDQTVYHS